MSKSASGFTQGIGHWAGTAEVYSGEGRFLGNGVDTRHVQALADGRMRIDAAFIGPFKHAGHYFIEDHKDHRLYQGPANVGYGESLGNNVVDVNAYWTDLGLSQRFFLMVLPDETSQLSLALMARGEQLIYVVVGQSDLVTAEEGMPPPSLITGTAYDLAANPTAGYGEVLLHRAGTWAGELTTLDSGLRPKGVSQYREQVEPQPSRTATNHLDEPFSPREMAIHLEGTAFDEEPRTFALLTNNWQAWTPAGAVVGSYNLSGGRALSGHFHHVAKHLRVWRREVVRHDGSCKAVLHTWYRGNQRIGVQYGVLHFTAR